MRLNKITAVLLCAVLLLLAGCAPSADRGNNSIIAASFYPVYVFTLNLTDGIEGLDVQCMAEQTVGCLHDYTLTAKDAKLLNDATVIVLNGAGMEAFAGDLAETAEGVKIIDSSQGVDLLCAHGEHEDEEDVSDAHSHHHTENAHIWMSVENAKKQVQNIKNGLAEAYPQHKAQLDKNCSLYLARLDELKNEMTAASKQLQGKHVVTFHNAYAYLARDMGFHIVTTIESDDGAEPSAKRLAELSTQIRETDVKALFTEPGYEGSAATILSAETGVGIYIINPVLKGEKGKTAYEDIMRENLKIILKAVK